MPPPSMPPPSAPAGARAEPPAGRSSITVAASRGAAGAVRPARTSWAPSVSRPRNGIAADSPLSPVIRDLRYFHDQVDLHRGVERQDGRPDCAARVPPGLPEHLEQQLAGPVDDL